MQASRLAVNLVGPVDAQALRQVIVVREAMDLVGGSELARLRECVNLRCTRLFVDTSRAGTRRWCGMTGCGNTAKVAAFRARRRASSPTQAHRG